MINELNIKMKELYEKFKGTAQYQVFVDICKKNDPNCTDDQICEAFRTAAIEQAMAAAFKKVLSQTIDETIMGTSKLTGPPKGLIDTPSKKSNLILVGEK